MTVSFVGFIAARPFGDGLPPAPGPIVDPAFTARFARAHEEANFDSVLIGYFSGAPDGLQIAHYAAAHTDRLRFLVAHRPGFVAPTLAARAFATLDHFTGGRAEVNIITGSANAEQRRDGDWVEHDERYRRTDEYLDVLRLAWSAEAPFTYSGTYYNIEGGLSQVRPLQAHFPVWISGSSDGGIAVAARHADVYMMWGEPVASVREHVQRVRRAAAASGRNPRVSVSFRPILAATEAAAWERAERILERVVRGRGRERAGLPVHGHTPENAGSQRLLAVAAAHGDVADTRLYTAIARVTGAGGNSTALVGTPEQVAESLLAYYDAGVDTFLLRGFDPLEDAIDYGRELIPLVRSAVAQREQSARRALAAAS